MKVTAPRVMCAAILTALAAWTSAARAQQGLPAAPVPVAQLPETAPVPSRPPIGLGAPLPVQPTPMALAPMAPAAVCVPQPLDPGRDGWGPYGCPSTGELVFFTWEFEVLGPAVKNRLVGTVTRPDGTVDTVHVPSTNLGWTVAPNFVIGYRLPDSQGEFTFGYRFIASDGTGFVPFNGGNVDVKSRLNVNLFDLDYATARYAWLPRWEMQFRIGARLGSFYYDSQFLNGASLGQHESSYFLGAGPHATFDLARSIAVIPGLSVFTRLDGSVLVGQISQRFNENLTDAAGNVTNVSLLERQSQAVPGLTVQAGLSYSPPRMEYLHFSTGYQFERYWQLGKENGSALELTTQGAFLRGEIDF